MPVILCDKIWQSNCEWNNLSQFYRTLSHTEIMPLFKLPEVFKVSERFFGQNSHKILPFFPKTFSSSFHTWNDCLVFNIVTGRIYLFKNILEIRTGVFKENLQNLWWAFSDYTVFEENLQNSWWAFSADKCICKDLSMRMWPLTVF